MGIKKNQDHQTIDWIDEINPELTKRKLRSLFDYNSDSGELINRVSGKAVGSLDKSTGYIRYRYNGKNNRVHRLIWLWLHGYIPDNCIINHRDNDRTNNSECNLRLLPIKGNNENITKGNNNNRTGIRGVTQKNDSTYIARITCNGKTITLGSFACPVVAGKEYLKQKELMHKGWSKNGI